MENIVMPKLGLTMSHGIVAEWSKHEGESFEEDEILCYVETNKISTELKAPCRGVITKILVEEGEEQEVLKPICTIERK